MTERTALFVDLDSLNVLYKVGGKFVAALNYNAGVDRIGETLPALGAGFDVYLCMKPRAVGEGDLVIDELSITGLPFTVDSEELYSVLKFFRDYSGFGEVYLCNWVNNFISLSRVKTFESAVYYGSRVAHMKVKDSILTDFNIYNNQHEFFDAVQMVYDGHGDVGLLDVDGLKAQYNELSGGSVPQLTALAPLIWCYRTSLKIETGELFERLRESRGLGTYFANTHVEHGTSHVEAVSVHDENLIPATEEPPKPKAEVKSSEPDEIDNIDFSRAKTPILAKLAFVACCLVALCFGSFAGIVSKSGNIVSNLDYFNQTDERIAKISELNMIYSNDVDVAGFSKEAIAYMQSNELGVSVTGFEYLSDNATVRCSSASDSTSEAFAEYVSQKYTVYDIYSLGSAEVGGETVYQYSVVFS